MSANIPFDPLVQELGQDIDVVDGLLVLNDEKMDRWLAKMRRVEEAKKKEIATQLVALGLKFAQTAGDAAQKVVLQLAQLVGILLSDLGAATTAFDRAGINLRKAAQLIGSDARTRPSSGKEPPPGSTSLMDFLLSAKKT